MSIWTGLTDLIDGRVVLAIGVMAVGVTAYVTVKRILWSRARVVPDEEPRRPQRRLRFEVNECETGSPTTRRRTNATLDTQHCLLKPTTPTPPKATIARSNNA